MGKVLEQAVTELSKLPEAEQEAAGAWILARSADLLDELAAEAIREDEAGRTETLDPEKL